MNRSHILIFSLFSLSSCSIDFNTDEPQQFSCVEKDDCQSGYECKKNVCIFVTGEAIKCEDLDGDGDGFLAAGENPSVCDKCINTPANGSGCMEDLNDDPENGGDTVFPGAPEICDGKDNDGDGNIDNTDSPVGFEDDKPATGERPTPKKECRSANDCPQSSQKGVSSFCDDVTKKCVARMAIQQGPAECNADNLICSNGSFPVVPAACGGPN